MSLLYDFNSFYLNDELILTLHRFNLANRFELLQFYYFNLRF